MYFSIWGGRGELLLCTCTHRKLHRSSTFLRNIFAQDHVFLRPFAYSNSSICSASSRWAADLCKFTNVGLPLAAAAAPAGQNANMRVLLPVRSNLHRPNPPKNAISSGSLKIPTTSCPMGVVGGGLRRIMRGNTLTNLLSGGQTIRIS